MLSKLDSSSTEVSYSARVRILHILFANLRVPLSWSRRLPGLEYTLKVENVSILYNTCFPSTKSFMCLSCTEISWRNTHLTASDWDLKTEPCVWLNIILTMFNDFLWDCVWSRYSKCLVAIELVVMLQDGDSRPWIRKMLRDAEWKDVKSKTDIINQY